MDRRAFLVAAAGLGSAGCAGAVPGGSGATDREPIRLDAVEAPGSPDGTVVVRPSDRPLVLDFFATWCAPCVPQMSTLAAIRDEFPPAELRLVSITTESDRSAVAAFWRRHDGAWPVALDTGLAATRAYGVTGVPTILAIDGDGREVGRHRGLADERRLRRFARRATGDASGAGG
jgi:thiol-disulfide isomerase/thioredoxin